MLDQVGDHRPPRRKDEPKGAAAHRSAAGFDGKSRRRGPRVLLPRRLADDRPRHALRTRRSQTHEHRARRWCGWSSPRPTKFPCRRCTASARCATGWRCNLPENVQFDTEPLRINGRSVMLEKQERRSITFRSWPPMPIRRSCLEMRYTLPGDGSRLDLPIFPEDSAAPARPGGAKNLSGGLSAGNQSALGHGRPLEQGIPLAVQPGPDVASVDQRRRRQDRTEEQLVSWVREGAGSSGKANRRFPNRRHALRLFHVAARAAAAGLVDLENHGRAAGCRPWFFWSFSWAEWCSSPPAAA